MPAAMMSKRERRGMLTREITYQHVLLAVHMLSDEEGLACDATVARIGHECGHSVQAVQRSIKTMLDRGVVSELGQWDGLNYRILILMDHPRAEHYRAEFKARMRAKWHAEMEQRVARKRGRA